ncbi:hypothetical protein V6N11_030727 [Hibiscus sabdariffa]|uniref:Uncharacterized protein n=2 Tax=Hibiscus sabdariffa TaxID=183260 RepID=A0ABR2B9H4_9ROSI
MAYVVISRLTGRAVFQHTNEKGDDEVGGEPRKTAFRSGMKQENSNGNVHEISRDKNVQGNSNGNAHENSSDKNILAQMNQDKPLNRDKDFIKEGEFVNQEMSKQARKTYKRIQALPSHPGDHRSRRCGYM